MPSPLADLYQRYKIGTKRVEQWLTDVANRDSIIQDVVSSRTAPFSDSAPGHGTETAIELSTKELITVTDRIVEAATAKGREPADLGNTVIILEDVISGRREYKIWHQQRTQEKDATYERDTASHDHFVDVLFEILTKLKGLQKACQSAPKTRHGTKRSGKAKKGPKTNLARDGLDDSEANVTTKVYRGLDPREAELTRRLADISISEVATEPKMFVTIELERPSSEKNFALWCFLKDCHKARLFLRSMWQEYYARNLGIQVAAEVTNKAFLLLSKAAEEFKADFPLLASFDNVADHLQIRGQSQGSKIVSFSYGGGDSREGSLEMEEAMELLCIPAFLGLQALRKTLSALGSENQEVFNLLDKTVDSHGANGNLIQAVFSLPTMPMEIRRLLEEGLWSDQFTVNLLKDRRFWRGELSLDHVMHYQIYLDIMETRNGRYGEPYAVKTVKRHMEDVTSLYKEVAPRAMKQCNTPYHEQHSYRDEAISFAEALMTKPSKDVFDPSEMLVTGVVLPYTWAFQEASPVYCGRVVNYIMQQHHLDGLMTCRQGGLVAAMAHLYVASLETGVLKRRWEDMDFVIDQLGPENLGLFHKNISSRPLIQCVERFGLAFGVKAADYSKERRRNPRVPVARVPLPQADRVVGEENDLYNVIKSPCLAAEKQRFLMKSELGLSATEATDLSTQQMAQKILVTDSSIKPNEEILRQWQACGRLEITEMLALLKQQMTDEEMQGCFDYQLFFVSVLGHFIRVKKTFANAIAKYRQAAGATVDCNVVEMAYDILCHSATDKRALKSSMLAAFAEGLDTTIKDSGSSFTSGRGKTDLASGLRF